MIPMKLNKKPFWVRFIDEANGMIVYTDPIEIRMNLYPMTADSDLISLGAEYVEYMRAKVSIAESEKYSVGDLIYNEFPVYKDLLDVGNAIYRITGILPMLNVAEIQCKRLSGAI